MKGKRGYKYKSGDRVWIIKHGYTPEENMTETEKEVLQMRDKYDAACGLAKNYKQRAEKAESRVAELEAALETERLRLAGCGIAAMSNTESSIAHRIKPGAPYYSASYQDACDAVDREIKLRSALFCIKNLEWTHVNDASGPVDCTPAEKGLLQYVGRAHEIAKEALEARAQVTEE